MLDSNNRLSPIFVGLRLGRSERSICCSVFITFKTREIIHDSTSKVRAEGFPSYSAVDKNSLILNEIPSHPINLHRYFPL